MPIKFNCHKCGANLRVPEQHIGKKARCPKCDEKCIVPEVSVRESGASGSFKDSDLLNQPMAAAQAAPVGSPPPMATPIGLPPSVPAPLPSSYSPVAAASPYSTPMTQTKRHGSGGQISGSVVQPLYEARTFIKIFGWTMFLLGILQFITGGLQMVFLVLGAVSNTRGGPAGAGIGILLFGAIIGLIVPFITTYIGWQIKGAGSNLTAGVETGSKELVRTACQQLANYFRIMGILAIIGLVIMGIIVLLMFVGVFAAFVA